MAGRVADAEHRAVLASLRELPARYLAKRAPHGDRRYRLEIEGCPPHVVLVHGRRCDVRPATDGRFDTTLRIARTAWLDLFEGRASGLDAFLAGHLEIRGDLNEALRLETLFAAPPGTPRAAAPTRVVSYGVAGTAVEAFEAGPGDGPPVLLLHGLGASKVALLPLIAGLAARHRVLAIDLPGFGKSGPPRRGGATPAALADCALAAIDAAGHERIAVVGNSLGGRIALELGLRHPERVAGLGLLCPAVAFDEYAVVRPLLAAVRADVALGLPLWPLPGAVVDHGLRLLFADPGRVPAANLRAARDDFLRGLRARSRRLALAAVARELALEPPARFWRRAAALAVPSLWIFGDEDRVVAPAYAALARRHVPGAVVEVWESCGHVPQFEHPARTLAAVEGHVTAHLG